MSARGKVRGRGGMRESETARERKGDRLSEKG